MTYRLFIDDERLAALKEGESIIVARSAPEAKDIMKNLGCPSFISFDHDLGDDQKGDGYAIAKWMVDCDLDQSGTFFPEDFEFVIHSKNPIGSENIEKLFESYFRMRVIRDRD